MITNIVGFDTSFVFDNNHMQFNNSLKYEQCNCIQRVIYLSHSQSGRQSGIQAKQRSHQMFNKADWLHFVGIIAL